MATDAGVVSLIAWTVEKGAGEPVGMPNLGDITSDPACRYRLT